MSHALMVAMFGDEDSGCGVSGSGVGDMIACPARLALPQAREVAGDEADRGNVIHEFCRTTTVNPAARAQALLDIDDDVIRATCSAINLEGALDGLTVVGCERAYALNVDTKTVRFIGTNVGRNYGKVSRYEVPFTVDVEARAGDVPVELDWKSGQHIGKVKDHWQRRTCAAGLIYLYDTPTAISRVGYIKEDGSVVPDGDEFSILDAEDYCDEIKVAIDKVWAARLQIASGIMPAVNADRDAQCRYCSAFVSCPYWTNLVKGASGKLREIEKGPDLMEVTAEEAGAVMDYIKDVLKVAGKLEDALKERALKEPLPINDKKEYRAGEVSGKSFFDAAAARGLLIIMMGRAGLSEEEITEKMAALNKQGPSHMSITKKNRVLPVLKKAS